MFPDGVSKLISTEEVQTISYQCDEHVNMAVVYEPMSPCVVRRRKARVFSGLLRLHFLESGSTSIMLRR